MFSNAWESIKALFRTAPQHKPVSQPGPEVLPEERERRNHLLVLEYRDEVWRRLSEATRRATSILSQKAEIEAFIFAGEHDRAAAKLSGIAINCDPPMTRTVAPKPGTYYFYGPPELVWLDVPAVRRKYPVHDPEPAE